MFTRLLKRKRGFTWNTDGEQLLRQHKPRYFDGTVLPRTVVLSEPLSAHSKIRCGRHRAGAGRRDCPGVPD